MRNNLEINFRCSDCGGVLHISSKDKVDGNKPVEFNSAYNETVNIFIEQCSDCKRKRDNLDNAIKIILKHGEVCKQKGE